MEISPSVQTCPNRSRNNLFVGRASGMNGTNGWMMLTRRGQALLRNGNFDAFRHSAEFSKSLLHPLISNKSRASANPPVEVRWCCRDPAGNPPAFIYR